MIEQINTIREALQAALSDDKPYILQCKEALAALDALEQTMKEPPNWIDLQKEADAVVRSKYVFKRFIEGTPLENDVACWMAAFASEKLQDAQQAQAEAVPQWQPIETAPKDGTAVDLWHSEFGRMPGWYWGLPHHSCGEMGSLCDSDWHSLEPGWVDEFNEPHSVDADVTHWMPLPAAPQQKGGV